MNNGPYSNTIKHSKLYVSLAINGNTIKHSKLSVPLAINGLINNPFYGQMNIPFLMFIVLERLVKPFLDEGNTTHTSSNLAIYSHETSQDKLP